MKFPNPFRLLVSWVLHASASFLGAETMTSAHWQEYRDRICKQCPFYDDGICQKCGCLALAKQSLALERCPMGYWERIWRKKVNAKR